VKYCSSSNEKESFEQKSKIHNVHREREREGKRKRKRKRQTDRHTDRGERECTASFGMG
jgi:hypothetical protein